METHTFAKKLVLFINCTKQSNFMVVMYMYVHIIIIGGHAKLVIGLLVVVHGNGFSGS